MSIDITMNRFDHKYTTNLYQSNIAYIFIFEDGKQESSTVMLN